MSALRSAIAVTAALAAFGAANQLRAAQNRAYEGARRVLDDAQIPHPTVARLVSLGHTEWMVDLLWINATLYYSDTLYARLPSRYLRSYTRTMSELDPNFRQAYLWGALALVYRTSRVDTNDVRDAVAVLRQGIRRFPNDPELRGQLGLYLAFELGPRLRPGSDEHRTVRAQAGEALRRACEAGWGPSWLPLAAASLLSEAHREPAALELLQGVLYRIVEPSLRERVESRIASLQRAGGDRGGITETLRAIDAQRAVEMPWISPTLYVFVGSSPLTRRGLGLLTGYSSARLR